MSVVIDTTKSGLRRSSATAMCLDPEALQAGIRALQNDFELHSFMLAVDGAVVAEAWWSPYSAGRLHMQHSATKSFMAAGVGLAVADGLLAVEDPVASFFPEFAEEFAYGDAVTVEHLLTMSVGHGRAISGSIWRPIRTSWVREFFREAVVHEPGTKFLYTSAASYMLSAIVQKVTGQTLEQYMRPRLFKPLGINDWQWDVCPHGISTGGNGLSCTTEALLKLGQLHLQRGVWEGQALLPDCWVQRVTTTRISPAPLFGVDAGCGYGYQWWTRADGSYYAWGIFGQYCIVMPQFNAVLAVTGGMPQSKDAFTAAVDQHLQPVLAARGRASSSYGQVGLDSFLAHAALRQPPAMSASDMAVRVGGRELSVSPNDLGIAGIRLDFTCSECIYTQTDSRGVHSITAGLHGWFEGRTSMTGNHLHHEYQMDAMAVAAFAEWKASDLLVLTWQFVESAFRDVVTIRFQMDGTFQLDRQVNANTGPLEQPRLSGNWS